MNRALGLLRLTHPFPSILDGVATGILALVAGAGFDLALRLGVAMVAVQFSIGALNDLADFERDRMTKPTKPLPAGLVDQGTAWLVVGAGLLVGLGLSASAGTGVALIAGLGTGLGYAYDVWLKPTRWAWLPFAMAIPLLPVYAWVGATGAVPGAFVLLVPLAVAGGGALALANGLVDIERDTAAGIETPATALGARRTWQLAAALQALVGVGALVSMVAVGADTGPILAACGGLALVALGVALGGSRAPVRRERGWELTALGLALLAAAWTLGLTHVGAL